MGLELARRIVQRHKGSLSFQSKPGQTEFEICLPLNN
jgi:nitrogen-specific signal transduction histidine kinase